MALVADIESTVMNSYATVSEASEYFAERGHGEAWESLDNQGAFLITATNHIDWFMKFKGSKVLSSQPLEWPRIDVLDSKSNSYIPIDIIPRQVKHAVFEMAFASIDEDRMADSDMAGLQEVKVGSLKIVANMVGPWQTKKRQIPPVISQILSGIIEPSMGMIKTVKRY